MQVRLLANLSLACFRVMLARALVCPGASGSAVESGQSQVCDRLQSLVSYVAQELDMGAAIDVHGIALGLQQRSAACGNC